MSLVASPVPTRAGTPISRAREAKCPATPPTSVTKAAARGRTAARAGEELLATKDPAVGKILQIRVRADHKGGPRPRLPAGRSGRRS